ncbi:MAG TPA: anaerobic ribonucleoside-triphosphate reductase activating protein [Rhodospirillaceae bacterium]|nr:anaerobic ribonucleoside-triphosphate reductase activating protein [Rhodospirillaceae bacterium]
MGKIYGITPFTLLDYPSEIACIAWFAGCNMRCVFCHNPDIVTGKGEKDESELTDFLEKRKGKLTAVVFSGGEPTLYPELEALMIRVHEMGFKIKLDTNGSRPEVLESLLDKNILNYVAMDYKCVPEKTEALIGTKKHWEAFRTSLALMIKASKKELTFEVRTTFHTDLMSDDDLNWIIDDLDKLGYQGTYYIQNIASTGDKTIGHIAAPARAFDRARIKEPKNFKLAYRNF